MKITETSRDYKMNIITLPDSYNQADLEPFII